jgi:DNA polymerase (family X)
MEAQRVRLRELEQQRGDVRLLHGAELNIGVDGSLDYDPAFLATFDWLVASVHSHFGRSVAEQTARVVAAIREPSVTAIGHLTGRMLGRRPGIELDARTGARRGRGDRHRDRDQRLAAPSRRARDRDPGGDRAGGAFVISTDAHRIGDLDRMRFGVAQARRAGARKDAIVNTRDAAGFLAWLDEVRGA